MTSSFLVQLLFWGHFFVAAGRSTKAPASTPITATFKHLVYEVGGSVGILGETNGGHRLDGSHFGAAGHFGAALAAQWLFT